MSLARRVRLGGVDYLFCDARTTPPAGSRRLDRRRLERLIATWGSKPALRHFLAEFAGRTPGRARWLASDHGRFDERHDLTCYELPAEIPRTSAGRIPEAPKLPQPQPREPIAMFDEQPHWVEVQILGEDDEGIAGVVCEIKLPSGKLVRRRSDRFGLVRIEGITGAGVCDLTFPELDEEAWERL